MKWTQPKAYIVVVSVEMADGLTEWTSETDNIANIVKRSPLHRSTCLRVGPFDFYSSIQWQSVFLLFIAFSFDIDRAPGISLRMVDFWCVFHLVLLDGRFTPGNVSSQFYCTHLGISTIDRLSFLANICTCRYGQRDPNSLLRILGFFLVDAIWEHFREYCVDFMRIWIFECA